MSDTSPRPLELTHESMGGAVVVGLQGSADATEVPVLRRRLEELLDARTEQIVLDLSGMDFIGSLGLGVLVEAHRRMQTYQGHLRLVNPNPRVRSVLETTQLTALFPIFDSVQGAMGA